VGQAAEASAREPFGADPDTDAMYTVRLAGDGRSVATVRVHLGIIQTAHRLASLALDLSARMGLEGIVRGTGIGPRRRTATNKITARLASGE
jgi:hypothetical protein